MRIALHPSENKRITIAQYIQEFGNRPLLTEEDHRPRARCRFCPAKLFTVAGRTEDTIAHFAHWPNSGYCPSKEKAGKPYLILTPTNPDKNHENALKHAFLNQWDRYYVKLSELIPYLSLNEFFALVKEANRLGIWGYRHLAEWEIPYTFILMSDFPIINSQKRDGKPARTYWFRFWYDSSVNSLEDLWINRSDEPTLFRASFVQPTRRGSTPKLDALVKYYEIPRERDYLYQNLSNSIPTWVKDEVEKQLPKILG